MRIAEGVKFTIKFKDQDEPNVYDCVITEVTEWERVYVRLTNQETNITDSYPYRISTVHEWFRYSDDSVEVSFDD